MFRLWKSFIGGGQNYVDLPFNYKGISHYGHVFRKRPIKEASFQFLESFQQVPR
jgi:hypothetical protein